MYSLRARVLLWLSVLLVALFAATIVALDFSMSASLSRARAEVLEAQLMALMATAEVDDDTGEVHVPVPPDRRLTSPESGLYGEVRGGDGRVLWRSPSALAFELPSPPPVAPGGRTQRVVTEPDGPGVAQRSLAVDWEFDDGHSERLQFVVAQSLAPYRAQQRGFRVGLVSWFGGLTLATLAVLALILRHVLRPLGRIADEIAGIENGERTALSSQYPRELTGVARNLNALVARERGRQQRYRDSLANLAHSLKTPLAAMQTLLPAASGDGAGPTLAREIDRMDRLIGYQLKRASAVGGKLPGVRAVEPAPLLNDLAESLEKVYSDKGLKIEVEVDSYSRFYGDEGDFQEVAGNLLDNACKYGNGRVSCRLTADGEGGALLLSVTDNGPGLDPALAEQAFHRGTRLDEAQPGQGIGLAVVADVVAAYGGSVEVARAAAGGAELRVRLPAGS